MNEMYLVVSGRYSDWSIEGYTDTEEEAKKVCEWHNQRKTKYDSEWYVKCIHQLRVDTKSVPMLEYDVEFEIKGKEWEITDERDLIPSRVIRKEQMAAECEYNVTEWGDEWHTSVFANIVTDIAGKERIRKIAQDRLAEFLYEHSNEIGGAGSEWEKELTAQKKAEEEAAKQRWKRRKEEVKRKCATLEKYWHPVIVTAESRGFACSTNCFMVDGEPSIKVTFIKDGEATTRQAKLDDKYITAEATVDAIESFLERRKQRRLKGDDNDG